MSVCHIRSTLLLFFLLWENPSFAAPPDPGLDSPLILQCISILPHANINNVREESDSSEITPTPALPDWIDRRSEADEMARVGRKEDAYNLYMEVYREAPPSDLSFYVRMGRMAYALENYLEASEFLEHALELSNFPSAELFYLACLTDYINSNYRKAKKHGKNAIDLDRGETYSPYGLKLPSKGNFSQVYKSFHKVIHEYPDSSKYIYRSVILSALLSKRYRAALDFSRGLLKDTPVQELTWVDYKRAELAVCELLVTKRFPSHWKKRLNKEASGYYLRALKLKPSRPQEASMCIHDFLPPEEISGFHNF